MSGDKCDRTCACPHTCRILNTSEKLPLPTSLSTVQSHMPNRSFAVATATLMTVTFCFHDSALSYSILHETFDMLKQQGTLYFGYTNLGPHVPFQIIENERSCKRGHTQGRREGTGGKLPLGLKRPRGLITPNASRSEGPHKVNQQYFSKVNF